MKRLVNSKEMAAIDNHAQRDYHIPGILLMENAGIQGWQYLSALPLVKQSDKPLLFVAGSGNNGGDCLVMARHAAAVYPQRVYVIFSRSLLHENTALQSKIVHSLGIVCLTWGEDNEEITILAGKATLIVDGISGTGLGGKLRSDSTSLISLLNDSNAYKAAIDIPSGLGDTFKSDFPVLKADVTLTMGLPKLSLYLPAGRGYCGEIKLLNSGFPEKLLRNEDSEGNIYTFNDFSLPPMQKTSYKNSRGHAAVFGGSSGFVGAAVLAATASGRVRTGMVTLHIENELYAAAVSQCTSVMVRPVQKPFSVQDLSAFSSYCVGPGWGEEGREGYLLSLLESTLPGVIDADGISVLASLIGKGKYRNSGGKGKLIITPHPGELAKFSGISKELLLNGPLPYLHELSEQYGLVIVFKSHVVYITSPDGRYGIIDGMNPALGTGGSGDILAGIITGFLAQGITPFQAAVNGALLHQEAGKRCFEDKGWFLSEELLPYLSLVIKEAGL